MDTRAVIDPQDLVRELRKVLQRHGISEYARPSLRSPLLEQIGVAVFPGTRLDQLKGLLTNLLEEATSPSRLTIEATRRAAKELFVLTATSAGQPLRIRREKAASTYKKASAKLRPETFRTGKNYEPAILEELATILITMEAEGPLSKAGSPNLENSDASYVRRRSYEQSFRQYLREGGQTFLLYGDAGTGKSTLAYELAATLVHSRSAIVRIHADNEDVLLGEIVDYLRHRGEQGVIGHKATLLRSFAHTLVGHNSPRVVVIDGAEDRRLVELLLPARPADGIRAIVIVTSRECLFPDDFGVHIMVGNMVQAEAGALVKNGLGDVADDEALMLAGELDYRLLVIEHDCAVMRTSGPNQSITDFCEMLRLDVVELLDAAPVDTKLTAIYRRILRRLEVEPARKNSLQLLDLVACMGTPVSMDVLHRIWSEALYGPRLAQSASYAQLARHSLDAAAKGLGRLSLVRADNRWHVEHLEMHALTRAFVCASRKSVQAWAPQVVLGSARKYLDSISWLAGNPLPHDAHHWYWGVRNSLVSLTAEEIPLGQLVERLQLPRTAAFLLRCIRESDATAKRRAHELGFALHVFNRFRDALPADAGYALLRSLAVEIVSTGVVSYRHMLHSSHMKPVAEFLKYPFLFDPTFGDEWDPGHGPQCDEAEILDAVPAEVADVGPAFAARWYQARATVVRDHDAWSMARDDFVRSFDLAIELPSPVAKSVALETVIRALHLSRMCGDVELRNHWQECLRVLRTEEPWASTKTEDQLLEARLRLAELNVALGEIFAAPPERDTKGFVDRVIGLVEGYERLADDCYHRGWSMVRSVEFGWARALALIDADRALSLLNHIQSAAHADQNHLHR